MKIIIQETKKEVKKLMQKQQIQDFFGFLLFLAMFLLMLIPLMISGAILRPIRYYQHVNAKVHDRKPKDYWY